MAPLSISRVPLVRFAAATLLLGVAFGCSCGEDPLSGADTGDDTPLDSGVHHNPPADATVAPDAVVVEDAGFPDAQPPIESRVLTFDGTQPVTVNFNTVRDLRFFLKTTSNAAVPGQTISFMTAGSGGSLNASMAVTDGQGAASVRFTAGNAPGQVTVIANADRATPLAILINVQPDPRGGIALTVASMTRITVANAEALIYTGVTSPACATLRASQMLPTATLAAQFATVPSTQTLANLTTGHRVTVYAIGKNAGGQAIAAGCIEGATIVGGTNTPITVTLEQAPTNFQGDYDVLLHFQLGNALPSPYDGVVNIVSDVLSNPAGYAIYATLGQVDDNFGTTFLTWTPPGSSPRRATFQEVASNAMIFNVWREATNLLDGLLVTQLGQPYVDVKTIGGDIGRVVRDFEVGARYSLRSKPNSVGHEIAETWRAIVYTWRYGCPQNDTGCARRAIQLTGANARLAPAGAVYTATVTHSPLTAPPPGESERFIVTPSPHAIVFRYGAVILLGLQEIVFPNLPGNLAGNTLTEVLGNIIRCQDVANSIGNATGLPPSSLLALCNAGLAAAAGGIEARLLALDSVNDPYLVGRTEAGVTGGGQFYLIDADHDLETDLVRDITVYAQWTDPRNPALSQDITAPITGDGRRAASGCLTDTDCRNGRVCAPIASYLKVKQLEKDCRRPIGTGLGMSACTINTACESGLCIGTSPGVAGSCYEACSGMSSCTMGTCTSSVASVNLDTILTGLGNATTASCMP